MSQPLQKRTDFYSPRLIACLWRVKTHSLSPPLSSCPWNTKLQISACVHAKSLQSCPTLCNPMDVAHQVSLSMGFSRKKYWSGLPFPPPEDLPDPGMQVSCVSCISRQVGFLFVCLFFTTSITWKALQISRGIAIKTIWLASPETDSLHFSLIYSWIQVKDKFALILVSPLKKKTKNSKSSSYLWFPRETRMRKVPELEPPLPLFQVPSPTILIAPWGLKAWNRMIQNFVGRPTRN